MLAFNSPSFENLITDFVIEIAVICFHYYIFIYIDILYGWAETLL